MILSIKIIYLPPKTHVPVMTVFLTSRPNARAEYLLTVPKDRRALFMCMT